MQLATPTPMEAIAITVTLSTVDTVSAPPFTRLGNDIDGEAAGDESGSVALSSDGTILAIGAHYNDGGGNRRGRTRIYEWNSGTSRWDQRGSDINGEWNTDYSGSAVSISDDGSVVAIGAISNNGDGNGNESGHTRIYAWDGSDWVQRGGDINGEASNDNSGGAVSYRAMAALLPSVPNTTTATPPAKTSGTPASISGMARLGCNAAVTSMESLLKTSVAAQSRSQAMATRWRLGRNKTAVEATSRATPHLLLGWQHLGATRQ